MGLGCTTRKQAFKWKHLSKLGQILCSFSHAKLKPRLLRAEFSSALSKEFHSEAIYFDLSASKKAQHKCTNAY